MDRATWTRSERRRAERPAPTGRTAGAPAWLLSFALLVVTSPSAAAEPDTSAAEGLPGIGAPLGVTTADPLYFIQFSSDHAPSISLGSLRPVTPLDGRIWGGFTHRRIKVIHYAAPLRVNQQDMTLNLEAPGAGRAIVSLELEF